MENMRQGGKDKFPSFESQIAHIIQVFSLSKVLFEVNVISIVQITQKREKN